VGEFAGNRNGSKAATRFKDDLLSLCNDDNRETTIAFQEIVKSISWYQSFELHRSSV